MSHRILPKLFSLLCMSLAAGGVWAQGNLAQEYLLTPKPGMSAGLATALRAHAEWRAQNGDPWTWTTYEVAEGEEMGTLVVRSAGHTWADFDAYEAGFEAQGATHFSATVGPLLESMSSFIVALDTAILRWPEDASDYTLFQIFTYHVIPSRAQQFNQNLKKMHDAIVEADQPDFYAFVSPVVGAPAPTVTLVIPARNWSEFEGPDKSLEEVMVEFYGAEEAATIFADFMDCFTEMDSMVLRLRPDLSVMAEAGN